MLIFFFFSEQIDAHFLEHIYMLLYEGAGAIFKHHIVSLQTTHRGLSSREAQASINLQQLAVIKITNNIRDVIPRTKHSPS